MEICPTVGGEKTKPIQACPIRLRPGRALSAVEWSQSAARCVRVITRYAQIGCLLDVSLESLLFVAAKVVQLAPNLLAMPACWM